MVYTESMAEFNKELDKNLAKIYSNAIATGDNRTINNIVSSGILPKQRVQKEINKELSTFFSRVAQAMQQPQYQPQSFSGPINPQQPITSGNGGLGSPMPINPMRGRYGL